MVEEIQGCLGHCADSENTFCRGLEGGKKVECKLMIVEPALMGLPGCQGRQDDGQHR